MSRDVFRPIARERNISWIITRDPTWPELTDDPTVAQLVERRTGIRGDHEFESC